jgi:hypothetical protein
VAITHHNHDNILLCRPGCPDIGWIAYSTIEELLDIIFHNGHLYGLNIYGDLFKFETGVNQDSWPMVTKQRL